MGCFWYCDCTLNAPDSTHDNIKEMVKDSLDRHITFDCRENSIHIGFYDSTFYGFGEEFLSAVSNVAAEFELDGECTIRTDEDEGEPAWRHTFEHGKAVDWSGEIIYRRPRAKPFYWLCYPMHGFVWAEDPASAQNMVMDHLREEYPDDMDSMDDIAVY